MQGTFLHKFSFMPLVDEKWNFERFTLSYLFRCHDNQSEAWVMQVFHESNMFGRGLLK